MANAYSLLLRRESSLRFAQLRRRLGLACVERRGAVAWTAHRTRTRAGQAAALAAQVIRTAGTAWRFQLAQRLVVGLRLLQIALPVGLGQARLAQQLRRDALLEVLELQVAAAAGEVAIRLARLDLAVA